jgi:Domain of unknown function (DUF4157)
MSYDSLKRSSGHHQVSGSTGHAGIPGKQTLVMQLKSTDDAHAGRSERVEPHLPRLQLKPSGDAPARQPAPAPSGGGQALPGDVQAKMGSAFGADFSAVRIHEGAHVSELGAAAYTQGAEVHFAPGQYQPGSQSGQELIGHELAHVVQQSQGRVSATTQAKGVDINDDSALEQEADAWGARAARGEAVGASNGQPIQAGHSAVQRKVIQKKDVATHYGTFKTTNFTKVGTRGVDCVLEFHPDADKIDATKIGLSQSVKITYTDGSHTGIDPTKEGRRAKSGAGADYVLDRISTKNHPIYGASDLGAGDGLEKTKQDNNPTGDPTKVATTASGANATYQLGYAYTESGAKKTKEAALHDAPQGGGNVFETVALGLEGRDQNKYFGSVKWGYELKSGGADVELKDIELASMGVPTQNYLAAAQLWNETKTRGTLEVTADPAKAKKTSDMTDVDVAKGTKLKQTAEVAIGGKPYVQVATLDGSKGYYVRVVDLKDTGDGGETVNVPIPMVFVNPAVAVLYSDAEMKTKVKELPVNTRMQNTLCTKYGSYGMKIVDGPDLGMTGYVDQTLIKEEK